MSIRKTQTCTTSLHRLLTTCVLVIVFAGALWLPERTLAQPGMGPSPVVTLKVISTRRPSSATFVGSLVPLKRSTLGSAVDGRVVEMFVDEGDSVTVDESKVVNGEPLWQPLVQLRTVSLEIEIEAAIVELNLRQQSESELQALLPAEIEAAESGVEEVKARLKYSKDNYDRLQGLFNTGGGVSRREIDEAFSTYRSQTQLNIVAATLLKRLTATRDSKLSQAKLKVQAQEAELRRLNELKDKYTIRAPFAGYVTQKNTELGQWVSRGDQVLEIIQLDPIELMVPVPQTYIQALQDTLEKAKTSNSKLKAQVTIESLPQLLEGEVIQIVPQADLRSRSFPVKILIRNPKTATGHLLKAGMMARASLFIGRDDEILLVKKDALVLGGLEKSLYVVAQDPQTKSTTVRRVSVEVGGAIDDWIQVMGDVKVGDQVVIEGNERLRPGQPIMVTKVIEATLSKQPVETSNK